jgi:lauroyl/myristoyl acyltransferase/mitochondrial fission protein ELM1
MKKVFLSDSLGYIALRFLGPLLRILPVEAGLFLGRRLADVVYLLDLRHRARVYAHLKIALGDKYSPRQLSVLVRKFYESYGQNLLEIFYLPRFDRKYLRRYIRTAGLEIVQAALKKGRGVIFLTVHAGSWELSNAICANLGLPFSLFVRVQRYPRMSNLLNSYRRQAGGRIIESGDFLRQMVQELKANRIIGMTADQGGSAGVLVDFFGRPASMAHGAVKLALKYGAAIIPVFYRRIRGRQIEVNFIEDFPMSLTAEPERDIWENLQRLFGIFERYIRAYPQEYLWVYKIWKYSNRREILILSDGRAGHLRQSQALAGIVSAQLKAKGIESRSQLLELKIKSRLARCALKLSGLLSGRYSCQGCLWCLRSFLEPHSYTELLKVRPDIVISCGADLGLVNQLVSRETAAKSLVLMRPAFLGLSGFDLAVIPQHDQPPRRKNVCVSEGALNLVDEAYLKEQGEKLLRASGFRLQASGFYLGLFIGGNSKNFSLSLETLGEVIAQLKSAAATLEGGILATTSRRTSSEMESLLKLELEGSSCLSLLVIANEKNLPEAVGGILGLSQVIICSPESISMISETAASGRYVVVFQESGLDAKHRRFLGHFARKKYIRLSPANNLAETILNLWQLRPDSFTPDDRRRVSEVLKRVI